MRWWVAALAAVSLWACSDEEPAATATPDATEETEQPDLPIANPDTGPDASPELPEPEPEPDVPTPEPEPEPHPDVPTPDVEPIPDVPEPEPELPDADVAEPELPEPDVPPTGNGCADPLPVDGPLPWTATGDTSAQFNSLSYGPGICPGQVVGKGASSPDTIYLFTAPSEGVFTVTLEPESGFDAALYILPGCPSAAGCLAASDGVGTEQTGVVLAAGQSVYVVVDGAYNVGETSGTYTLTIDGPCTPACEGKSCGSDGCGLTCGSCEAPQVCDESGGAGACVDPAALPGNSCDNAFEVGGLPFSASGDTLEATALVQATCGGELLGDEAPEQVWAFTPAATDDYLITVQSTDKAGEQTLDAQLYVLSACTPEAVCLAGKDDNLSAEAVLVELTEGVPHYIVVDGWSDTAGTYDLGVEKYSKPAGDSCDHPAGIDSVPFEASGSTKTFLDFYADPGGCTGDETGQGGADAAWALTPAEAGSYTFTVTPIDEGTVFDTVLYLVTDCQAGIDTCVGGADEGGSGEPESLTATLAAGTTYYLIVDSAFGGESVDYALSVQSP